MPSVPRRSLKALVWVLRPSKGGAEVLLLQRPARRGGGLHPVTGKAEEGEEPLAAASREVLEETHGVLAKHKVKALRQKK